MEQNRLNYLLDVTRATLQVAEYCFLITISADGLPNARLMQPFQPEADFTIWFGTSPRTRKVNEIQADKRVSLGYAYSKQGAYVTLVGEATIITDSEARQQYWRKSFEAFWPAGPTDDDYILIKFVPLRIELMNIELDIAPDPYGLRPEILVRGESGWQLTGGYAG